MLDGEKRDDTPKPSDSRRISCRNIAEREFSRSLAGPPPHPHSVSVSGTHPCVPHPLQCLFSIIAFSVLVVYAGGTF